MEEATIIEIFGFNNFGIKELELISEYTIETQSIEKNIKEDIIINLDKNII
jgi:hypothetical protein